MNINEPTALYRHWRGETLLYVGISQNLLSRNRAHERLSIWLREVDHITVEWHPTRLLAEAAERVAIQSENPVYNRTFNIASTERRPGHYASTRPGRKAEGAAIWSVLDDGDWHRIGDVLHLLDDSGERMRKRVRLELVRLVDLDLVECTPDLRARKYRRVTIQRGNPRKTEPTPVPTGAVALSVAQIQTLTGASQESIYLALRRGELRGHQPKRGGRWFIPRTSAVNWALGESSEIAA